MSINELPNGSRTPIQVITESLKANAISHALSHISDDVMTSEELSKETDKAVSIMEDAIYKILAECDLYGDDAIIEVNNVPYPARYSCHSFVEAVLCTATENVDKHIN